MQPCLFFHSETFALACFDRVLLQNFTDRVDSTSHVKCKIEKLHTQGELQLECGPVTGRNMTA